MCALRFYCVALSCIMLTCAVWRVASETGAAEQKRLIERKRALLVLIHAHLVESGE